MSTIYQLGYQNEWITLFTDDHDWKNEEMAMVDFEDKSTRSKSFEIEDKIRDLYCIHAGKSDSISSTTELLKILLANSFQLRSIKETGYEFILSKCFFPVEFVIVSKEKTVSLGKYFITSTSDAVDQFKHFCSWQDRLSGVSGNTDHMIRMLIESGHEIYVIDGEDKILIHP